ncbi:MAG: sugar phosphate nucleotidyltransferase [bacterium]|nr:sugar phosphate nucleotidyltransferase [bacterium]
MKGIILAGGTGARLRPLTNITNKHLIAVYDRPMIDYPLQTLLKSGIRDILIVSGREHAGHFINYLGSGKDFDAQFTFRVQEQAGGIADALGLAESFTEGKSVAVILGDNFFEDIPKEEIDNFNTGSKIFLKSVDHPEHFGIATMSTANNKILHLEEKPINSPTNLAITGFYLFDNSVFSKIKHLVPSKRGELEITDVLKSYLGEGSLHSTVLSRFWGDMGQFATLAEVITWLQGNKKNRTQENDSRSTEV